jgi:predicted GNAT superfamily acetyltransferase
LEADTPIINASSVTSEGLVIPSETFDVPTGSLGLVEIPESYEAHIRDNMPLAVRWQGHIREVMQRLLANGYIITDFVRSSFENRERAFYLFSQADKAFERIDFSNN